MMSNVSAHWFLDPMTPPKEFFQNSFGGVFVFFMSKNNM